MYHTSDFDFELPPELIATHPLEKRDSSRMLVVDGKKTEDKHIQDFISYLRPGDVVVFNNSRVIPARFEAGEYEITLHTAVDDKTWWGLCKKFNKINVGDVLTMLDGTTLDVLDKNDESGLLLRFNCDNVFDVLDRYGKMPLPPYIKREEETEDRERYQTVYAEPLGSMAAPTAGLHFTDELLSEIEATGAKIVKITLHVGAGTWMPVKTEDLSEHKMHSEWCCITPEQADIINNAKRVIAVGTTSMRTLESAHQLLLKQLLETSRRMKRNFIPAAALRGENATKALRYCRPETRKLMRQYKKLSMKELVAELLGPITVREKKLWGELKLLRRSGYHFLWREPLERKYIADFLCPDQKLIIEMDTNTPYDEEGTCESRTQYGHILGFNIMRICAQDLDKHFDICMRIIKDVLYNDNFDEKLEAYKEKQKNVPQKAPETKAENKRVLPICQTTDIFITPGYKFGAVDVLLTNFHLPKSTLFMLVSAFVGLPAMKAAYKHAVDEKYRFFSYGDCCLLFRKDV